MKEKQNASYGVADQNACTSGTHRELLSLYKETAVWSLMTACNSPYLKRNFIP